MLINNIQNKIWLNINSKLKALFSELQHNNGSLGLIVLLSFFGKSDTRIKALLRASSIGYFSINEKFYGLGEICCKVFHAETLINEIYKEEFQKLREVQNIKFIFLEHYPLENYETWIISKLQEKLTGIVDLYFYLSIDDQLFEFFENEDVLKRKSIQVENNKDFISNSFVTNSIKQAQRKLQEKYIFDRKGDSLQEWLNLNKIP